MTHRSAISASADNVSSCSHEAFKLWQITNKKTLRYLESTTYGYFYFPTIGIPKCLMPLIHIHVQPVMRPFGFYQVSADQTEASMMKISQPALNCINSLRWVGQYIMIIYTSYNFIMTLHNFSMEVWWHWHNKVILW